MRLGSTMNIILAATLRTRRRSPPRCTAARLGLRGGREDDLAEILFQFLFYNVCRIFQGQLPDLVTEFGKSLLPEPGLLRGVFVKPFGIGDAAAACPYDIVDQPGYLGVVAECREEVLHYRMVGCYSCQVHPAEHSYQCHPVPGIVATGPVHILDSGITILDQ